MKEALSRRSRRSVVLDRKDFRHKARKIRVILVAKIFPQTIVDHLPR
jgi:hypothetical protein